MTHNLHQSPSPSFASRPTQTPAATSPSPTPQGIPHGYTREHDTHTPKSPSLSPANTSDHMGANDNALTSLSETIKLRQQRQTIAQGKATLAAAVGDANQITRAAATQR